MVIKQEVFVLLNTTAKQLLQHRTLDSVLALMALGGQRGSVALEGVGGHAKDSPKQHQGAQPCPSTGGEG